MMVMEKAIVLCLLSAFGGFIFSSLSAFLGKVDC